MTKTPLVAFTAIVVSSLLFVACQKTATESVPAEDDAAMNAETSSVVDESVTPADSLVFIRELATQTTYQTPAGEEHVGFTVMVNQNGEITDAQTDVQGKAPISIERQTKFSEELPTVLVGKKLADLEDVDRVGGSSLTTGAFNKSLEELKAQL